MKYHLPRWIQEHFRHTALKQDYRMMSNIVREFDTNDERSEKRVNDLERTLFALEGVDWFANASTIGSIAMGIIKQDPYIAIGVTAFSETCRTVYAYIVARNRASFARWKREYNVPKKKIKIPS